jgi:thioesterase domain-containing protein
VHGCTGKVLHFYDLARLLDPEQPFYGLSALGLEKGQIPHTQIEDMAAHYIKEIRTIQFNGPYFIGASGWGCAIVLEMAHQLESQGQNLALMLLLTPSPLKPNISTTNLDTYGGSLRKFFRLLIVLLKNLLFILLNNRPLIPAIYNAFSNRVLWHFRIFHRFIPIEIHRRRHFIAAFRRARFSYTPRAYQGRMTCFLREEFSHNHKKVIGDWYDLAVGGLEVRFVPGNIFTMWKEPHVQILAEKLTACLNEAKKNS